MDERILKIIRHYNLSISQFSREIGLNSPATIQKIITYKRNASPKTTGKILNRFKDISYDWLITGQGEMLNESKVKAQPLDNDNLTLTSVQVTDFMKKYYPYSTEESEQKIVSLIDKSQDKIINYLKATYIPEKVSREVHFDKLTKKMYKAYKILDTKITHLNKKMEHIDMLIEEIEKYNLIEEIRKVQLQNKTK